MDSAGIFGQVWLVFAGLGVDVQPSHFLAEVTRGFTVGPALNFTSQASLPADLALLWNALSAQRTTNGGMVQYRTKPLTVKQG